VPRSARRDSACQPRGRRRSAEPLQRSAHASGPRCRRATCSHLACRSHRVDRLCAHGGERQRPPAVRSQRQWPPRDGLRAAGGAAGDGRARLVQQGRRRAGDWCGTPWLLVAGLRPVREPARSAGAAQRRRGAAGPPTALRGVARGQADLVKARTAVGTAAQLRVESCGPPATRRPALPPHQGAEHGRSGRQARRSRRWCRRATCRRRASYRRHAGRPTAPALPADERGRSPAPRRGGDYDRPGRPDRLLSDGRADRLLTGAGSRHRRARPADRAAARAPNGLWRLLRTASPISATSRSNRSPIAR
jgi:hypothetical protein